MQMQNSQSQENEENNVEDLFKDFENEDNLNLT